VEAVRGLKPHKARTEKPIVATATPPNPTVTVTSCHAGPANLAPVIGDNAAVPNAAASDVTNQLPYAPATTVQKAVSFRRGGRFISDHPRAKRDQKDSIDHPFQVSGEPHPDICKFCFGKAGQQSDQKQQNAPPHQLASLVAHGLPSITLPIFRLSYGSCWAGTAGC
jgi:hypothetical protein